MKKLWAIVAAVVAGLLAIFLGKKRLPREQKTTDAPKNTASEAAQDAVQESFKEAVDRIKSATDGESPADDLADLGNARRR
tara:strand:+ start:236 stop:478 length:243 start_codon:yes stop_codon:yes gene_type:complete